MPNIAVVLKEEIRRLARREIKAALVGLRKDNARLKRTAAEHKRRIAELEKARGRLRAGATPLEAQAATAAPDEQDKARVTGGMIRRLRERLAISQADLAKLIGVSAQSVYQWEKKAGRLTLRGNTKDSIVQVRKLGKREVKRRLEESAGSADPARKPRKRKASEKKAAAKPRKRTRKKSSSK